MHRRSPSKWVCSYHTDTTNFCVINVFYAKSILSVVFIIPLTYSKIIAAGALQIESRRAQARFRGGQPAPSPPPGGLEEHSKLLPSVFGAELQQKLNLVHFIQKHGIWWEHISDCCENFLTKFNTVVRKHCDCFVIFMLNTYRFIAGT